MVNLGKRRRGVHLSLREKKERKSEASLLPLHRHVGLAADLFHFIVYFAEDCLIPACGTIVRFAEFKKSSVEDVHCLHQRRPGSMES